MAVIGCWPRGLDIGNLEGDVAPQGGLGADSRQVPPTETEGGEPERERERKRGFAETVGIVAFILCLFSMSFWQPSCPERNHRKQDRNCFNSFR